MARKPLTREELGRKLAEIDQNPGIFSEFEVRLAREAQEALRAAEARIEALRDALGDVANFTKSAVVQDKALDALKADDAKRGDQ